MSRQIQIPKIFSLQTVAIFLYLQTKRITQANLLTDLTATSSSTYGSYHALNVIDGNTENLFHSDFDESPFAWWQVDLKTT